MAFLLTCSAMAVLPMAVHHKSQLPELSLSNLQLFQTIIQVTQTDQGRFHLHVADFLCMHTS